MANRLVSAMSANQNVRTEKGALAKAATGSKVLDFFSKAPAMRGQDITALFSAAYAENSELAIVAAFYMRDIRGGQGERAAFRQVLNWLRANDVTAFVRVMALVPEYGRWDDILAYHDFMPVMSLVENQLESDLKAIQSREKISLLAKWMPSENASSTDTRRSARAWMSALRLTAREYRVMLSTLRAALNIVEIKMSAGNWSEIEYATVASRAMKIYRKAFGKRDQTRFAAYLTSVEKGEVKINASTLYPYDLIAQYRTGGLYARGVTAVDRVIEAQWAALPNYIEDSNIRPLAMCDVSGSMESGTPRPMDSSIGLGLYMAERLTGPFNNQVLRYDSTPRWIDVSGATLRDRIRKLSDGFIGGSTDIWSAFKLIVDTAIKFKVPASDMPTHLFIFSDMQFDAGVSGYNQRNTMHDNVKRLFAQHGYTLPTVVYWNLNARPGSTPVTAHENGVMLVAGQSPSTMKSALNCKVVTPYDMMLATLHSERYAPVAAALQ